MDAKPDLKLGKLYETTWSDCMKSVTVEQTCLEPIAKSFAAGVHRLHSGIEMVPFSCFISEMWANLHVMLEQEFDKLGVKYPDVGDKKLEKEVAESVKAKLNTKVFGGEQADANKILDSLTRHWKTITSSFDFPFMREGFVDLLFNQSVGAWTIYEVLATDLWVTAVNRRPKSLGRNAWVNQQGIPSEGSGETPAKGFDIDLMSKYDFDLSNRMGTMIKHKRIYGFNKLSDIVDAYFKTFRLTASGGKKSGVPPEVNNWFSGADFDQLRTLESVRHATVHRGGYADLTFLERVAGHSIFGQLRQGDLIPLDGEIVHECTLGAVNAAIALLKGVDRWLSKNPH